MKIKNIYQLLFYITFYIIIGALLFFIVFYPLYRLMEYLSDVEIEVNTIIAIIGVITCIFLFFKSRTIKQSVYTKKSFTIINEIFYKLVPYLQTFYNSLKIKNLTVCFIAFWNNGNITIDKNDIPSGDPLRIEIPNDIKILEKSIVTSSNKANKFNINGIYNNSIKIDFDYLDPNEGGVIKIIHDGSTSKNFFVRGRIKGAAEPAHINLSEDNLDIVIDFSNIKFSLKIRRNIFGFIFILVSLFFVLVSLFTIIFLKQSSIPLWGNVFCYTYLISHSYQKLIKIRTPKEFSFIDETI